MQWLRRAALGVSFFVFISHASALAQGTAGQVPWLPDAVTAGGTGFVEVELSADTVVPLPPDPGEAGKATLEGIDSDGDGLRDDVQRYIAFTFADSARVRAAAADYAKKVQETFFVGIDRAKAVNLASDINRSIECMNFVLGSDTYDALVSAQKAGQNLNAEVLNTAIRSRSYLAYDAQLAGGVYRSLPIAEWKKSCTFNPDVLPN